MQTNLQIQVLGPTLLAFRIQARSWKSLNLPDVGDMFQVRVLRSGTASAPVSDFFQTLADLSCIKLSSIELLWGPNLGKILSSVVI